MNCEICKQEDVMFEDDFVKISHGKGAEGHLQVFPKNHLDSFKSLSDEEVVRLFFTASFAATVVFETLNVQGTNIIFHNNSDYPHLISDVIPRTSEDGINLQWDPIEVSPEEFKDIAERIASADENANISKDKKVKPIKGDDSLGEEDYRVKHLERTP